MMKVRCPICDRLLEGGRSSDRPAYPFCSERCRLIDLGRWLGERYCLTPEAEGDPPENVEESEHS
jgi:endogenous inhibitor of DNA gyrase (YacG/DUF329 family)